MRDRVDDASLNVQRFVRRVLRKTALGVGLLLCAAWGWVHMALAGGGAPDPAAASFEWPMQWDGAPLRPLALSSVERRFAQRFPGALGRFTDGHRMLVLRHVTTPTRMLHPATDCYRASGYRIEQARLEHDAQRRLWRCFTASRAGNGALRVCERIVDADGRAFTDTSGWYWAAVSGQSQGPWQAVTTTSEASAPRAATGGAL